jgi:hypothetical protein
VLLLILNPLGLGKGVLQALAPLYEAAAPLSGKARIFVPVRVYANVLLPTHLFEHVARML